MRMIEFVKFEVYLPEESIVPLREALNKLGILTYGNYDHVLSYTCTKGYWRPLKGSKPVAGTMNKVAYGQECKLEFRSPFEAIEEVKQVIRHHHPYDEAVVHVIPLL